MLQALRVIAESYLFILLASLLIGLFLPAARHLIGWTTLLLQAIFFLSSLKIDWREVVRELQDWTLLAIVNVLMLVVLPLLVCIFVRPFFPEIALPLFLLAAMPAGMTTPLFVDVIGGKQTLALVVTVTSSLLAPFTIPFMTKMLYGSTIQVDVFAMFRSLVLVILIPFVLAMIVQRVAPTSVKRMKLFSKPIAILLLGLLIAGAVSAQADRILVSAQSGRALGQTIVVLFVFFGFLHAFGYGMFWWRSRAERRTLAVSLTYMNFTLAIFLAAKFFPQPEVLLPLVLAILPWATLLPVWNRISARR